MMFGCLVPLVQIWIAPACGDTTAPPVSGAVAATQSPPTPGSVAGPPWRNWLPPNVVLGSLELGPLILQPTLNLQLDGFSEVNNGWGGQHTPAIQDSEHFFEQSNEEGLNGRIDADPFGELSGRISGIFDMSGGGLNAAATNQGQIQNDNYSIEDAYLKWTWVKSSLGWDTTQSRLSGGATLTGLVTDFSSITGPVGEGTGSPPGWRRITPSRRAASFAWTRTMSCSKGST